MFSIRSELVTFAIIIVAIIIVAIIYNYIYIYIYIYIYNIYHIIGILLAVDREVQPKLARNQPRAPQTATVGLVARQVNISVVNIR